MTLPMLCLVVCVCLAKLQEARQFEYEEHVHAPDQLQSQQKLRQVQEARLLLPTGQRQQLKATPHQCVQEAAEQGKRCEEHKETDWGVGSKDSYCTGAIPEECVPLFCKCRPYQSQMFLNSRSWYPCWWQLVRVAHGSQRQPITQRLQRQDAPQWRHRADLVRAWQVCQDIVVSRHLQLGVLCSSI